MPTLILSPRHTEDSQLLWRAAGRLGWGVERLVSWRIPDDLLAVPEPELPQAWAEPEPQPWSPPAQEPAAAAAAVPEAGNGGGHLSDADVDRIARRVVELLGDKTVRDVAWEVIPDMAEVIIRDRLRELESQVE